MRFLFLLPFFACSNDTIIEKQTNKAPTVIIMSHSDGGEVFEGYIESFRATVADDDNNFDELSVAWYVGEELVCDWAPANAAGESFCEIVFEASDTNLIAEVRDPIGSGGRFEIALTVIPTETPTVEILSPYDGETYYADQLIQFSALVADAEDESEDLLMTWTSSLDGELSLDTTVNTNGEISDFTYLTQGNHAIELRVEDTTGKFDTAEVVVQVGGENTLPTCGFDSPLDSQVFVFGESVFFSGTATDSDIPNDLLSVEVSSNLDGVVQTLNPFSDGSFSFAVNSLSAGTHTMTLSVQDEIGAQCSTGLLITIGTPPQATINNPQNGDIVTVGDLVSFEGVVADGEDQANLIAIEWLSDLDGVLQSGTADAQGGSDFTVSTMSTGIHTIDFIATDTTGLSAQDSISLHVNTLPVIDSLSLSPDPLTSDANLNVTATTSDADNHSVGVSYIWFENSVQTAFTGTTIPASELDVGEVWMVRATPFDGFQYGLDVETSLVVVNTPPMVTSATIAPSAPVYNDTVLTCSALATDVDQTIVPTYEWSVNGNVYAGSVLDLSTLTVLPTTSVTCTASAVDSQGEMASASATVVVENRAPSVANVVVSPSLNVLVGDTIQCMGTLSDPDGETLIPTIEWSANGAVIGTGSTLTVPSNGMQPGDTIECTVSTQDGYNEAASASATIVLDNTNPVVDSIAITPTNPSAFDTITCTSIGSDAEGSTLTYAFGFTNLSTGASYSPTSTFNSSALLDLSTLSLSINDVIECSVSISDIQGGTAYGATTAIVTNSSPNIDSITISPSTGATIGATLTCVATASDPDDGALTPTYQWTVNNGVVSTQSTYTVNSNDVSTGDILECVATAVDSDGQTVQDSTNVVVTNTPPTLSNLTISPSSAITNDATLTCSVTAIDPEETVVPTYTWSTNGTFLATGANLNLANYSINPNSSVECTADVVDSAGATDSVSTSVTIGNRPPSITTPVISNTAPEAMDTLTCFATASDADGETPTVTYTWLNGATAIGSGSTLSLTPSLAGVGDFIICQATATDSYGGTTGASTFVNVVNTAPTISNISISPNPGYNTSTFTCAVSSYDVNGTIPTVSITWQVSGGTVGTGSSYTANTSTLQPNDTLVCLASIDDGSGGTDSGSTSIAISNRAPAIPSATISWSGSSATPVEGDELTCTGAGGSDPDGQSVSYSYSWVTSASNGPNSGQTVGGGFTVVGDSWTCSVTATDGTLVSSPATATVTIESDCGLTDCDSTLDLGNGQTIDLIVVPGGDDPLGRYTLSNDFYLMPTEVTQGMFAQLMSYDPLFGQSTSGVGLDHPVYFVDWHQAADFANRVTQYHNSITGAQLQECYSCTNSNTQNASCSLIQNPYECTGYYLPTDGQFEYATRSETVFDFWTPDGGGDYSALSCSASVRIEDGVTEPLLSEYAWFCGNATISKEVATRASNGFDLYDMSGNVQEWTTDDWGCSFPNAGVNPICDTESSTKVKRNGSWDHTPSTNSASGRFSQSADAENNLIGFRLARNPITAPSAPVVAVNPPFPIAQQDDLVCVVNEDAVDPEGANVTYTFEWSNGNVLYAGATLTTQYAGDTLPAQNTLTDEVWTCTVIPNDGTEDGQPGSSSVLLGECGLTECDRNLDLGNGVSIDLNFIPSGTFIMGSPSSEHLRFTNEALHTVTLSDHFYVMTTEVTQAMYETVMGTNPSSNIGGINGYYAAVGDNYPVAFVDWDMAAAYANELTTIHNSVYGTTYQYCYSCNGSGSNVSCSQARNPYECTGFRLLTEAEWEYAARSGTSDAFWTPNGGGSVPSSVGSSTSALCASSLQLTDGTLLESLSWYCSTYGVNGYSDRAKQVALAEPNGYGLYDMHGNLYEWVEDKYAAYPTGSVTDPIQNTGPQRIVRGGFFDDNPSKLRSAYRFNMYNFQRIQGGFRVGIGY